MMCFAEYSDGKSAKIHQVKITFESEYLNIEGFSFNDLWAYSELCKIEKTKTNFTLFKGEEFPFEQLHFDNVKAYEYFRKIAPYCNVLKESHIKFEKNGTKAYLFSIFGIFGVLAFFHFLIIPFSVNVIAENFPKDMEAKLGENYLAIANQYGFIDSVKTNELQRFSEQIDFQTDYDLKFYVVESDMVNAFALPGGRIIVFTALIDSMTNYHQLVSLMGHEAGHVELRHSLQSIFEEQSYNILLSSLSGGNSEIIDSYLGVATTLNSLHGSRSHEKEADSFALKVLLANKGNPKGVVELFEILAKGGGIYVPDVLSTHPSPEHRIKELNTQIEELSEEEIIDNDQLKLIFVSLKSVDNQ